MKDITIIAQENRRFPLSKICMIAIILAAGSYFFTGIVLSVILEEGDERRDQNCLLFETDHKEDVDQLRNTYDYLEALPKSEWGNPFTQALIRQLPLLRKEAAVDSAPEYCDEPNTGLPEPDPVLPRERTFSYMKERRG